MEERNIRKRQRVSLPDLQILLAQAGGGSFDSAFTFQLLTKVDAKDAMSFAIASGNDPSYHFVADHLRHDAIWKYWMQRDLQLVFDHYDGKLPIWIFKDETQQPQWKVYYLWARLVISTYQWLVIHKPQTQRIMRTYPPGSVLKYVSLNTIELAIYHSDSFVRPTLMLLDFRIEFPRMFREITRPGWGATDYYSTEDLSLLNKFMPHNVFESISTRFKANQTDGGVQEIANICVLIFGHMTESYGSNLTQMLHVNPFHKTLITHPPRMIEFTRILVGAKCAWCTSQVPAYRCGECIDNRFYCNKQCLLNDGHTH